MTLKTDSAFNTRIELSDEESIFVTKNECSKCEDPLIFAMKDNDHSFSIGLFTIIKCLKLAEESGAVPNLSDEWWIQIFNRYKNLS